MLGERWVTKALFIQFHPVQLTAYLDFGCLRELSQGALSPLSGALVRTQEALL